MNTEPDDDLDSTAELPLLNLQAVQARRADSGADATDQVPAVFVGMDKTGTWQAPNAENWPLLDELLTVRDKIVDLEAAVLDAELKLAKLDKQHQDLQQRHVELSAHDAEVSRDRDRLDAERALLLETRQQLKQQFEAHQAASASSLLALQQQLEQQQQQASAAQAEHADHQRRQLAETTQRDAALQQLSTTLAAEQEQVRALQASLHAADVAHANQETAAAALARNLSHELLDKETIRDKLRLREQRIQTLELAQQQLTTQLATAEINHRTALTTGAELQTRLQAQLRQVADLQASLSSAEERIARLGDQVETEHGQWRSAEQDKERLTRLASAEHESYESTRKELSSRLAEIGVLQEQLAQARSESTALGAQLAERETVVRSRDELLATRQQALLLAAETQAASAQRETALTETLTVLREELRQTQAALHERGQLLHTVEQQLLTERHDKQQVQTQLETTRQQAQQAQTLQRERDQFILDQATELEKLQHVAGDLQGQLQRLQVLQETQQARAVTLETELATLQVEHQQQSLSLSQVQQELADKHLEQGASAKQVEALQHELHQHVEAMNAIRRDIHQVAQQSRYRESELMVRTLVRDDDPSVVQLLNKAVMVIGRATDADICIHSESISRRHACLRVGRDVVIIEDMGSTNGCYVNGKRVKRQLLKDGDKLELGEVRFRFTTRVSQS